MPTHSSSLGHLLPSGILCLLVSPTFPGPPPRKQPQPHLMQTTPPIHKYISTPYSYFVCHLCTLHVQKVHTCYQKHTYTCQCIHTQYMYWAAVPHDQFTCFQPTLVRTYIPCPPCHTYVHTVYTYVCDAKHICATVLLCRFCVLKSPDIHKPNVLQSLLVHERGLSHQETRVRAATTVA